VGDKLQIAVSDSGPGIPPEREPLIGKQPITKSLGERGLGMGLLMAQMILQTYNGDLAVGKTGPTGTTMLIQLPIESSTGGGGA
jgi:K+-sensing histidine kinase KdpD